ncbi:hypothetical protein CEXT_599641 [Caerostris extrusa]|uniref:Uncharacterized protein n=1 Tax=Caerostris extrusa TaxID=172846 RepID=A0AAV4WCD4_CAEEX|nr:hypothetical protein CEXT_599641 [Caerostris extrusa]
MLECENTSTRALVLNFTSTIVEFQLLFKNHKLSRALFHLFFKPLRSLSARGANDALSETIKLSNLCQDKALLQARTGMITKKEEDECNQIRTSFPQGMTWEHHDLEPIEKMESMCAVWWNCFYGCMKLVEL